MRMDMEPEMTVELAVATAQQDIVELQQEFKDLHKMVTGNGDPQKGLVWMATLQGRLIADLSTIVEANRLALVKADGEAIAALKEHREEGHYSRQSAWTRIAFGALGQATGTLVLVIMFLITIGFLDYVRSGRIP